MPSVVGIRDLHLLLKVKITLTCEVVLQYVNTNMYLSLKATLPRSVSFIFCEGRIERKSRTETFLLNSSALLTGDCDLGDQRQLFEFEASVKFCRTEAAPIGWICLLFQTQQITPQLALQVLLQFDKAINTALANRVRNRVNFRVSARAVRTI